MEAPEVKYARTNDGVNIAYWSMGSGVPVVWMDAPYSNVQYEWQQLRMREAYERSAQFVTVVRYDHRGLGRSDPVQGELTTDMLVSDLEAVVEKLELPPFLIFANRGTTGRIALEYASRHPDRVRRMAIFVGGPPANFVPAIMDAPGADWQFVSDSIMRVLGGADDEVRAFGALLRASTDKEGLRRYVKWWETPSEQVLSSIRPPTLFVTFAIATEAIPAARALAAGVQDGSVAIIAGDDIAHATRRMSAAVNAFLGRDLDVPATAMQRAPTATDVVGTMAVILFLDIADSTALTERMGDAAFRSAANALDRRLREAIRASGGALVEGKTLGDGVLATFSSARQAIDAAQRCNAMSAESELRLHLGLHAGDVIREADNVYGGAVNIAARISGLSAPGEILVSATVRDLARTSAGVTFDDAGEREMKGVGDPVRVYRVVAA